MDARKVEVCSSHLMVILLKDFSHAENLSTALLIV
jgi:hypothetical protein